MTLFDPAWICPRRLARRSCRNSGRSAKTQETEISVLRAWRARKNTDDVVLASVHALETLLVEEKYLPLARHLLNVPAATAELQFRKPCRHINSLQTKGAIDYLLIERIVVGGGNEIARKFKCSEVPRLTGCRLFFGSLPQSPGSSLTR